MIALIKIATGEILATFPGPLANVAIAGLRVDAVGAGWEGGGAVRYDPVLDEEGKPTGKQTGIEGPAQYRVVAVAAAAIPAGKRPASGTVVPDGSGGAREQVVLEDIPVTRVPTPREKIDELLSRAGVTLADLKAELAK